MSLVAELVKYPLPSFLEGRCTPPAYFKWLNKKADTLLKRGLNPAEFVELCKRVVQYRS